MPIKLQISCNIGFYKGTSFSITSDICPEKATNQPISNDRIIEQLSKTGNTQFEFSEIDVELGDNLYIPKFSVFNELRRQALEKLESTAKLNYEKSEKVLPILSQEKEIKHVSPKISILLNNLDSNMDYSNLENVNRAYIPLRHFLNNNLYNILGALCENQNIYIYMPTITKKNYANIIHTKLNDIVNKFKIKGFVVSNLSQIEVLKEYSLEIIGNYTLNVFNNTTVKELENLNLDVYTISPELDKQAINNISARSSIPSEIICYGYLPLMNCNYCLLGKSNKCYSGCKQYCKNSPYYLKDRMGFLFEVVPDNIETVTTIYNSKITSISPSDLNCNFIRLDFMNEDIDEINTIIRTYLNGERMEGQNYTNGNVNREV